MSSAQTTQLWYYDRYWQFQVAGMREYLLQDGTPYFWRPKGSDGDWRRYEQKTSYQPPAETPLRLMLVRQNQGEGQPKHWALFVARENENGTVYQVKGDAVDMRYAHAADVNILGSASVHSSYVLSSDLSQTDVQWIQHAAQNQAPPSAPSQRDVKENCQGWTVRVMYKLAKVGVISQDWIQSAIAMMDDLS